MHKIVLICTVLLIVFTRAYNKHLHQKNSETTQKLTIASDCLPDLLFQIGKYPRNSLISLAWGKCGVKTKPPYANEIPACVSCDLRQWLSWTDTLKHHDIIRNLQTKLRTRAKTFARATTLFWDATPTGWLRTAWSSSSHWERRRDRTCCVRNKLSSCLGKIRLKHYDIK